MKKRPGPEPIRTFLHPLSFEEAVDALLYPQRKIGERDKKTTDDPSVEQQLKKTSRAE